MIKVLNVLSGLNNAGTEAVVMNYYRHIDRTQVQFDFLVLNEEEGYYEPEIRQLGGNVYKIPGFTVAPLRNIRLRNEFFKEHRYDIVEVHAPSPMRYAYCKLAKKSGSVVIFHGHNTTTPRKFVTKYCVKQLRKYCDQIVACSQKVADITLMGECDKVIPNAIDYDKYKFSREKREHVRNSLGVDEGTKVIGCVARFSDQKNQSFLVDVFAKACAEKDNLLLYLKGFGEDEAKLRAQSERLGLQDRVLFNKGDFEAHELYSAFDLYAMPSKYEGLSVAILEAQACGCPSIVSDKFTKEADILGYVTFLPLEQEAWVKAFCNDGSYDRRIISEAMFEKTGYSIARAALLRQQEYIGMVKK